MTMSFGPNLGLLVDGSPGEQHLVNLMKQFRGLDGLVQAHVKDKDLATPPASPADGVMYIVATASTGVWAGHAGKLARYYVVPANGSNGTSSASGWEFFVPRKGWRVHVEDEDVDYQYNGTDWVIAASGGGGGADNSTETVAISSGVLNLSATTKEVIVVNLNQNVTSITMPAGVSGQAVNRRIVFTQSGASNFTVTGWTGVSVEGGTAPVAATGTGAVTEYMLSNTSNSGWRMYVDRGVVERGSNANGEYVRFSDGTQICTSVIPYTIAINTALGALFYGSVIGGGSYPAAFSAPPATSHSFLSPTGTEWATQSDAGTVTTRPAYYPISPVSRASASGYSLTITAIGRWF